LETVSSISRDQIPDPVEAMPVRRNGWFVVFLGPYETSDIARFRRDYSGPQLPPDAMLTRGTNHGETVWQPSPEPPAASSPPSKLPAPTLPTSSQPAVEETPAAGDGATIKVERMTEKNGQEVTFISIEGDLVSGDEKRFAAVAIGVSNATVGLNSRGGSVDAGIGIGKAIRLLEFSTLVPEGFQCASACALAWLGGTTRFMGLGATVGFHAVFTTDNGQQTVSSAGNAVVGAYLSKLGLPDAAVAYITEKQPNDIQWLTFDDAAKFGIEVSKFPQG
jgi:hypothetical protein